MTHPSEHQFPHSRAQTWWQFKSNGADVSQWTHLYIRVDWKPYPKTTDRPLRHLVALGLPSASDSAVISRCHMLLRWSKYKPHTTFLGMLGISLQTTTKKTLFGKSCFYVILGLGCVLHGTIISPFGLRSTLLLMCSPPFTELVEWYLMMFGWWQWQNHKD